ncbi:Protein CBG01894 [Caenorhabditis briggsae]|uniref:Protein CBG01894 n=3 Tax=Caenorhabditis briggsae TaxID=6238 RepID=A8WRI6_CAEBR|nr:Protein CBG01894 [Caenorhabditis briggsae]ULT80353.1 hypothetical protein L3Y34_010730 [Caenorhabditis briggsae]CAP23094.2 Protein CBG01894 [Caenorhabditis briggsae]
MITTQNPDTCVEPFIEPSQWFFTLVEIILSVGGLVMNTVITVICHKASPMPHPQRRLLASISINFAILSGFQLARNFFLFLVMQQPCLSQVTTVSCKLQEFPLIFCYIHCAATYFLLGIQSNFLKLKPVDKSPMKWYLTCSVWQTLIAAASVALSLLFTAFDQDLENEPMNKCSILLAVSQSFLTFTLLTILILLHAFGLVFIVLASLLQRNKKSWIAFTIFSLKEIIQYETLVWQTSLFVSGCVVLYRHVLRETCDECAVLILELAFVILPLMISFAHPLYLVWYVLPMRDAATRTFPCMLSALPEYSLVPPQVPTASTSATFPLQSPRTELTPNDTLSSEFKKKLSSLSPKVVIEEEDAAEWSNDPL